jgi:tRNA A58 N-methylase Trm61
MGSGMSPVSKQVGTSLGLFLQTDDTIVFLDLPAPWEAIPHAVKTLRPDLVTKICCFSPCLEQVLKTVTALRAEGFSGMSCTRSDSRICVD